MGEDLVDVIADRLAFHLLLFWSSLHFYQILINYYKAVRKGHTQIRASMQEVGTKNEMEAFLGV